MGILKTLILFPALLFSSGLLDAQERFALIIGNEDYQFITKLKNPLNDASDVADALKSLGFQVELLKNASLSTMEDAVVRLGNNLGKAAGSYGFFFYAGHGIQAEGVNYLVPTDAEIKSVAFLKNRALSVQEVLDTLQQAGNGLNIVVLDACRDNPFSWSRSTTRGLAVISGQPPGSIIAYATSAGATAQDGSGRNGLFTGKLLENLKTPGLEIKDVFNRTGEAVIEESNNRQVPAVYTQYFKNAYLAGPPREAVHPAPLATEAPVSSKPTAAVGPAGGFLVAVGNGKFLEAADTDLGKMSWNDAVLACQTFALGGSAGWRLPTKDELHLLYLALAEKNQGGFDSSYYWSSTENNSNGAWCENFDNGTQNDVNKALRILVRPVRQSNQ